MNEFIKYCAIRGYTLTFWSERHPGSIRNQVMAELTKGEYHIRAFLMMEDEEEVNLTTLKSMLRQASKSQRERDSNIIEFRV